MPKKDAETVEETEGTNPEPATEPGEIHVHACTKCGFRGKTPELVDGKCPRCGATVKVER